MIGGTGKPQGLEKGYYAKPTIFADVENDMTISKEEIFGPVLSMITYKNIDDAVAIANDMALGEDGTVTLSIGTPDIGGSRASMALMVSETLGIPYEDVRVNVVETGSLQ